MEEGPNSDQEIRAARNQAMFRYVNEKIKELNESFNGILGNFAIACECGDAACVQLVEIPADAYEAVRSNPRQFVVAPGHVFPNVEQVVAESDGYVIVENTGVAGEIADDSDPRSATTA